MPHGPVIGIFGPTASGKSAVAEAIAELVPADIVSADAMQLYRGVSILTNQPNRPTRLTAVWSLGHKTSVGEYQVLAHAAIDEISATGQTPIVVGGTGLYFRAALVDLELPPPPAPGARDRAERLYERLGPEHAHAALAKRDPAAAAAVHPNDRRRVVRALELVEAGGSLRPEENRLWSEETRYPTALFGLDVPHELLAARIEERTRAMFERGAEEEVRAALAEPLSPTARHVIGLQEIGSLQREEAIEAVGLRTRRYAAYQRKWMRRIPGLELLDGTRPPETLAEDILEVAGLRQKRSEEAALRARPLR